MQFGNSRGTSVSEEQVNDLSVELSLGAVAYSVWVPAFMWDGPAPAVYESPSASGPGHWLMQGTAPEAASKSSKVYYYMRRPLYWQRGHIEAGIHCMFSDSVNTFVNFGFSFVQHNLTFPALTTITNTIVAPPKDVLFIVKPKNTIDTDWATSAFATAEINPAPKGIYDLNYAEPNVPPNHDGLFFSFGHDSSGDAALVDVKFYGAELTFYQHEGSIGGKFYGDYHLGDTHR